MVTVCKPSSFIQDVPGGKVNILGDHSIGHSTQKSVYARVLFRTVSEIELFHCTVHCTLYRQATRHVLTLVAKFTDVDGEIFENLLYCIGKLCLHNLYSSPSIIRMIKSKSMRWAGHVARMGRRVMHIGYWRESQIERDH
jgi:hypothetical protein